MRNHQQNGGDSKQFVEAEENKTVRFRWMKRKDFETVLAIARNNLPQPIIEEDFLDSLHRRNRVAQVAVDNGQIVGYMVYELEKNRIHLLSLVVRKSARRQTIGRRLVENLIRKLEGSHRAKIVCQVNERNLAAQLFLRQLQFKAVAILRHYDKTTEDDAYLMRYRLNNSPMDKKGELHKPLQKDHR